MSRECAAGADSILRETAAGNDGAGILLQPLAPEFSVCKVTDYSGVDREQPFCFTGCTEEEKSLVCPAAMVPENTTAREDGWKAFRVCGELDFSLIGIFARIAEVLAAQGISIFALSTYNTDYVLTKKEDSGRALQALEAAGCRIEEEEKP